MKLFVIFHLFFYFVYVQAFSISPFTKDIITAPFRDFDRIHQINKYCRSAAMKNIAGQLNKKYLKLNVAYAKMIYAYGYMSVKIVTKKKIANTFEFPLATSYDAYIDFSADLDYDETGWIIGVSDIEEVTLHSVSRNDFRLDSIHTIAGMKQKIFFNVPMLLWNTCLKDKITNISPQ